jgi:hypothetical protein
MLYLGTTEGEWTKQRASGQSKKFFGFRACVKKSRRNEAQLGKQMLVQRTSNE